MSSSLTTATRRPKWQYSQPQPTPRILQLPRRPRSRKPSKSNLPGKSNSREKKGRLVTLFDEEREFTRGVFPVVVMSCGKEEEEEEEEDDEDGEEERRERVEEEERESVVEEEKWRFQAEMLRAECNLLRMEREIAVKKMERRRVHVERILRSSIQTLVSGRNKIYDGEDVGMVLEEEIKNLVDKLAKLQRRSGVHSKHCEVKKNCGNFDKQASILQRRLVKVRGTSDETCVKEIQEMAEASLSIKTSCRVDESFVSNESCRVEILRRKMEGLSKGVLLERMEEEYGPMLTSANSSAASSTSTSRRIELPDLSSFPIRHQHKEGTRQHEEKVCSGHCKAVVRRIVEQVRAETEQWSQMQEMLGQVRDEIEELQVSRDFWEDRALHSDHRIQSLVSAVQEWRHKALSSETKANELQSEVIVLQKEIERLKERETSISSRAKISSPLSRDAQYEMEKRILVCRMKENNHHHHHQRTRDSGLKQKEALRNVGRNTYTSSNGLGAPKRTPLGDIGNVSPLARQNSKAIFPLGS